MQYLHEDTTGDRKSFSLGWKVILFGVLATALSLAVSLGLADLFEVLVLNG